MNIGVIGFGNLGKAFVSGLIKSRNFSNQDIYITAKTEQTLIEAKTQYHVNICRSISELVDVCHIIVIIVKPAIAESVIKEINEVESSKKIFVSFMAGIQINKLKEMFYSPAKICRVMPNLSIEILQGISAVSIPSDLSNDQQQIVKDIFKMLGIVIEVDESEIEKFTALSACGLGFVAHLIEGFVNAGINMGISRELSTQISIQTFFGALKILIDNGLNPEILKERVATKGGATESGLTILYDEKVAELINKAFKASYRKVFVIDNQ